MKREGEFGIRLEGKFASARRVLRVLDLVSRRGSDLTAKAIARELGVSLSTCYCLLNVLIEEGYLERLPRRKGYRLGPALALLHERGSRSGRVEARVEPVVRELAERSLHHAYLGVLSGGLVTVAQVEAPPRKSPPVGIVRGYHAASHALALGKVLIAHAGDSGLREYLDGYGLEPFTPRTITSPGLLREHLAGVRSQGFALDVEEFAENLCCVAAPVLGPGGRVEGAIGLSTSARRFGEEGRSLVRLVRRAADEASALLSGGEPARAG
ncbi:IclR family transcriptional regulator [Rubrobacter xylanophilus]|uniref:IclR family transcriptional regulator n=1 Tax=Rubrobacter xylanophilus TaxID=49319 RepID=A0A510HHC2_9ACTN|nr:IclR family transcriptional regulator [Rubrobacter xylanophilus]BBL79351.1 IclR family transcriptional regulator [Rubrobacter xylanophilus]